ncbi:jg18093 [Pararge aegeria aegeria]|uniref:Jg18093 protein n=1 Tax=Pararge aegeria aegeria TaxID=348720 RepID=A0A8S4RYN1_9NEOP|nr:jg18093 [Pararge aegeria aegeria]
MYDNFYRVEVSTWDSRHLSRVLALDGAVWKTIVSHYDLFCTVDDNSLSRSLLYLSLYRGLKENKSFEVVYSTIPRVFETTSCLHNVLGSCDILENVVQVLILQKKIKNNLFPPYLEVYTNIELDEEEHLVFVIAKGGWNDPRDKNLCRNITFNKVLKLLFDMEPQFQDYSHIIT